MGTSCVCLGAVEMQLSCSFRIAWWTLPGVPYSLSRPGLLFTSAAFSVKGGMKKRKAHVCQEVGYKKSVGVETKQEE